MLGDHNRLADLGRARRERVPDVAAHNHRHDGVFVGGRCGYGANDLSVLQDRDAVGDGEHFRKPVRDEDDRGAGGAQFTQNLEKAIGFGGAQRRRRLVQDQHPGIHRERAGNFDDLALGQRQAAHRPPQVDLLAEPRQEGFGFLTHSRWIDPETAGLAAEVHVLDRVEVGNQARVLVDHRHAEATRLGGTEVHGGISANADLSGVRLADAGENSHERRLAGTVLANERVDFPRAAVERDVAQSLHARKRFGDSGNGESRRGFVGHGNKRRAIS